MIVHAMSGLTAAWGEHVRGTILADMSIGKWVFVGTLGLVLLWLIVMPRSLIGQAQATPPWWRNVRIWAIIVCSVQIWIYWRYA